MVTLHRPQGYPFSLQKLGRSWKYFVPNKAISRTSRFFKGKWVPYLVTLSNETKSKALKNRFSVCWTNPRWMLLSTWNLRSFKVAVPTNSYISRWHNASEVNTTPKHLRKWFSVYIICDFGNYKVRKVIMTHKIIRHMFYQMFNAWLWWLRTICKWDGHDFCLLCKLQWWHDGIVIS